MLFIINLLFQSVNLAVCQGLITVIHLKKFGIMFRFVTYSLSPSTHKTPKTPPLITIPPP